MNATCPWDPMRVEVAANSPERANAILELLLQQGARTLATMEAAEDDEQVTAWRRAAHGLAGSALNLGMQRLAVYCRQDVPSTATQEQRQHLREGIRAELQRIADFKHALEQ